MQVSDIARRVRESAGDVGVIQFSNETLTDWINDAVRECVTENSLLQAKGTSNTVIGQSDYVLPADIFKLHSVWVDGYKLDVLTLEQWEERNAGQRDPDYANSDPYSCYLYAGVLTLFPAPDSVKTLQINYTKLPATITYNSGTQVWTPAAPSIPEAFHNRLVTYCLAQVALQDDDYNKYASLLTEFRTGVIDLRDSKESDDLYPFISVSGRDQGEWYYDNYNLL